MKLFAWTKPRTASVEELRDQLANATKAHDGALAAVESAQDAFDDAGDQGAARALSAARETAAHAAEHVGRARRLLDGAEAQRAAEERAELQAKYDTLAEELFDHDAVDAELVEREAKGWLVAIEVRAKRHAHFAGRAAKRHELEIMSQRLGNAPMTRFQSEMPQTLVVARIVRDYLDHLEMGPVRELAFHIAQFLDPNGR